METLLARQPELKAEFARLQADARVAKEVLPLANATTTPAGELPGYARVRLQAKVRQTFGPAAAENPPSERENAAFLGWRWWLGIATCAAVLMRLVHALRPAQKWGLQVAMVDVAGASRGATDDDKKLLQQTWPTGEVRSFTEPARLAAWEKAWPESRRQTVAKIVYDRAAGELRVIGRRGGASFSK